MRRRVCPAGTCERTYARPHAALRPGVHSYRGFRVTHGEPRQRLVVPRGTVSLVVGFGPGLEPGGPVGGHDGKAVRPTTSLATGLHTRARHFGHRGALHGVEITLAPWAAHQLFGVSMSDLADTVIDPADVLGRDFEELTEALRDTTDWPDRFALLDSALARWTESVRGGRPPAGELLEAWDLLVRTGGTISVRDLAAATGWSWRHLETLFRRQFGLTPKRLARIIRLRRALRLLTTGNTPADTAYACGFSDQAHLTNEFTALLGMPPRRFLAARGTAWRSSHWVAG
ncbi:helix-turn-helix domain-containing protein [Streptomyces triticiradicis]|uniref:Helix-turn-helix domain-containing protein n=1 Tax=Streptomyces triticiradicis TaxID=2651189 RepID=A0A7J5D7H0_9ACTN|nr:helix-turn-helix domain-containing protein [Streptomyces triticiradicis]KAB1981705.1 helix-turn-helix domain-containing protein [Streptomyces triticiradicis]